MDPASGLRVYLVGGALRDELLGLPVRERDWVVVGATREAMLSRGFRAADSDFPVYLHPETGEEYALARRERKQGAGYRGFVVDADTEVTLEEDLARRDLTINAMARGADGAIIDPFGGQEDLEQGLLRHVTPAFVEDPLRMARIARFAARLGRWGFRVAHGTHGLLKKMAEGDDLDELTRERLWRETRGALVAEQPWRYFEVLQRCGGLARWMPEISAAMDAPGAGHGGGGEEISRILQRAARRSSRPEVRFAALLGAVLPAAAISRWCEGYRCQRGYHDMARRLAENLGDFTAAAEGGGEALYRLIANLRCERDPGNCDDYCAAAGAIQPQWRERAAANLETALTAWRSVRPAELQGQGLQGRELGEALARRRREAIDAALGAASA